jgi:hypothetical protein
MKSLMKSSKKISEEIKENLISSFFLGIIFIEKIIGGKI